ncbi:MAG TPA: hypothetical protein VEC12_15145 [Bacteroidia bacterium]|nr:hypothetical protein [Bacteroidia bacterium]
MKIYTYIYIVVCIMAGPVKTMAQGRSVDITVGDSILLQKCSDSVNGFLGIDMVTKTRWIDRGLTYDSITGEGFYYYFFNEGDFDSHRLPCEYSGKKFRVVGIQQIKKDTGDFRTILFGRINDNPLTVLWVEVDQAIALKELVF